MFRLGLKIALAMLIANTAQAGTILYQTGFESPTFQAGDLIVGQDGWSATDDQNVSAATITDAVAASGSQSLRIDGSKMDLFLGFPLRSGYYAPSLNLDPVAQGIPIIEVSVDVRVDIGSMPGNFIVGFQAYDLADRYLGGLMLMSGDSGLFAFANHFGTDSITALDGQLDTGVFHHLGARFDYQRKMIDFLVEGQSIGSLKFNRWEFGIARIDLVVGSDGSDPFNTVGYFDNYQIRAIPEPSSLISVSLGLLSLGGLIRRIRHRKESASCRLP